MAEAFGTTRGVPRYPRIPTVGCDCATCVTIQTANERCVLTKVASVEDGHWRWTGAGWPNDFGYVYVWDWIGRRMSMSHRFVYEILVGEIPDGYDIDHLCRQRWCVNPAHLEAVTRRENLLRSTNQVAASARQTHCIHGHAFDVQNTYTDQRGRRHCRACKRDRRSRAVA